MAIKDEITNHKLPVPEPFDERREQRLINEIMELLVTHHGGSLSDEALDRSIDDLQRALHPGARSPSAAAAQIWRAVLLPPFAGGASRGPALDGFLLGDGGSAA